MKKYWSILLLPLGVALTAIARLYPAFIESYYTRLIFRPLALLLRFITGWLPFSLAELLGFVTLAGLITGFVYALRARSWRVLGRFILRLVTGAATLYFAFVVMWGLNYSRLPLATTLGFDVGNPTQGELVAVIEDLIVRTNALREQVSEDTRGVMKLPRDWRDALKRTQEGYTAASATYPVLRGRYGTPKGVMASTLMSYYGIGGIYIPFTGEANVNILMPDVSIPFTAAHEVAHQHGFAREDEANFVAYLTCIAHPDVDFRYSGVLHALSYSLSALYDQDRDRHRELVALLSPGVKRDFQAKREFWARYEGPLEDISRRMNDAYLKANRQEDGVASYGRMVDLLIGEYRAKK